MNESQAVANPSTLYEQLAALWEGVKAWIGQVSSGGIGVGAPAELKAQPAVRQSNLAVDDPPTGQNPPSGVIYRSYYFVGSVRVAMREFTGSVSVVSYIVTDHLGSTRMTLDASGVVVSTTLYKLCPPHCAPGVLREGETRYSSGTASTDYKYTGQMEMNIGINHYGTRLYDPYQDFINYGQFSGNFFFTIEKQGLHSR